MKGTTDKDIDQVRKTVEVAICDTQSKYFGADVLELKIDANPCQFG